MAPTPINPNRLAIPAGIDPVTGTVDPSAIQSALPGFIDPVTGAVNFDAILAPKPRELPGPTTEPRKRPSSSSDPNFNPPSEAFDRTPANNYGYIDKPMALGVIGLVGGPVSKLGSKMISMAINANNVAAANAARKSMGLEEMSKKEKAQGLLSDNKGYIGDVVSNGQQYAVSIGGVAPDGRTALTPEEARSRAVRGGLRLATPKEVKEAQQQAKMNPDMQAQKGFVTRGLQAGVQGIQNAVDTITGRERPEFDPKFGPQPATVAPTFDPTPVREVGPEVETVEETFSAPVGEISRQSLGGLNPPGFVAAPDIPSRFDFNQKREISPSIPTPTARPTIEEIPGITQTPTARPERTITPGAGLRNLADVSNFDPTGTGRPDPVQADLAIAADWAVKEALGPGFGIQATSGTYNPETQARIDAKMAELEQRGINPNSAMGRRELQAVGQVGSTRHSRGMALDFAVVDSRGNLVTDPQAMEAVAGALGRQGVASVGYGKGYMGAGVFHADVHRDRASTWGGDREVAESFLADRNNVGILPKVNPPTPTPKPDMLEMTPVAEAGTLGEAYQRDRAPEIRDAMAYTIAGELSPTQLENLASPDPERREAARQEIAAIATTIDNRANSTRFAELEDPRERYANVLTPGTYNSLMKENREVTDFNYSKFGEYISTAIDDYDKGALKSPVPDATHYRSIDIAAPSWENTETVQVGDHVFSTSNMKGTTTPEYTVRDMGVSSFATAPGFSPQDEARTAALTSPDFGVSSFAEAPGFSPADEARGSRMASLSPTAGFGTLGQASILDAPSRSMGLLDVPSPQEGLSKEPDAPNSAEKDEAESRSDKSSDASGSDSSSSSPGSSSSGNNGSSPGTSSKDSSNDDDDSGPGSSGGGLY